MKPFKCFIDDSGSVSIMSAAAITIMLLIAALGIEGSRLYVAKLHMQRTADVSTLAAAITPSPLDGRTPSPTAVATATNMAAVNGLSTSTLTLRGEPSPALNGRMALVADIEADMPLQLGKLLVGKTRLPVGGSSWVELGGQSTGDCLRSLAGPLNIYDNAVVHGPGCIVAAATFLHVCGKAVVEASHVSVGYSAAAEKPYICPSASMAPPLAAFNVKTPSVDTLAALPQIKAIKARLQKMGSSGWPYGSTSPAASISPATPAGTAQTYVNQVATLPSNVAHGGFAMTGSTLTFSGSGGPDTSCSAPTTISGPVSLAGVNTLVFHSGCYAFGGSVTAASSSRTVFKVPKTADVTFVFKQGISNGSGSLTFENGKFVFGAGISNGTGQMQFGNGPFYVNGGTITNDSGTLTFGKGPFYLWGGSMKNASTGRMTFDDGPFYFYGGTVTNVRGIMTFGKGAFEFQGGTLSLEANSNTTFGTGDMNFYGGSVIFGGDSLTLGAGGSPETGGSSVFLHGGTLSLTTRNLTAIGTTIAFQGGTMNLLGTGTINATAPTSPNPAFGYQNVLFVVYGGAFSLYQSAVVTNTMSGAIYVPASNVSIYGKQRIRYPKGGCFQVSAGILDIYQSADLATAPCGGLSAGGAADKVAVIQ